MGCGKQQQRCDAGRHLSLTRAFLSRTVRGTAHTLLFAGIGTFRHWWGCAGALAHTIYRSYITLPSRAGILSFADMRRERASRYPAITIRRLIAAARPHAGCQRSYTAGRTGLLAASGALPSPPYLSATMARCLYRHSRLSIHRCRYHHITITNDAPLRSRFGMTRNMTRSYTYRAFAVRMFVAATRAGISRHAIVRWALENGQRSLTIVDARATSAWRPLCGAFQRHHRQTVKEPGTVSHSSADGCAG